MQNHTYFLQVKHVFVWMLIVTLQPSIKYYMYVEYIQRDNKPHLILTLSLLINTCPRHIIQYHGQSLLNLRQFSLLLSVIKYV